MVKVSKLGELSGHSSSIYALDLGQTSTTVFTGSGDKVVAEWDIDLQTVLPLAIKTMSAIYAIKHIKSKNLLIIGCASGDMHWIDLAKKEEIHHFTYHQKGIFQIVYNETTNDVVIASGDGSISTWSIETGKHIRTLYLCEEKIRSLAISPDGQLLAVGSGDHFVRIFETTHYNEVKRFKAHDDSVNALLFHPKEPLLYSAGKDAHIKLWNKDDDYRLLESVPAHNYPIYSLSINTSGTLVTTGSRDKTIKVWDAMNLSILKRIDFKSDQSHNRSVNNQMWIPDSNLLVSVGDDAKIMIWEIIAD